MEVRDSKENNQAKASKWPLQINKGTLRVLNLCCIVTCKIPQTATAWVWDTVVLHAQILMHPDQTSNYILQPE